MKSFVKPAQDGFGQVCGTLETLVASVTEEVEQRERKFAEASEEMRSQVTELRKALAADVAARLQKDIVVRMEEFVSANVRTFIQNLAVRAAASVAGL